MDYLIGKRRKSGDPTLWFWSHDGIVRLSPLTKVEAPLSGVDWGECSMREGAEVLALVIAAILMIPPEPLKDVLPHLVEWVHRFPSTHFILSISEMQEQLSHILHTMRDQARRPSRLRKRGGDE